MGGSINRMKKFANFIKEKLQLAGFAGDKEVSNLSRTDRYVIYKIGKVLTVSHGIGVPSISIVLNEIIKVLSYAGANEVVFFRVGTSGGLGTEPGTVVITKKAVNGSMEPKYENMILGKRFYYPSDLDSKLASQIQFCSQTDVDFPVIYGDTMCASDFYEGQARLDGAFCEFNEQEKMTYLKDIKKAGVCNIEMESLCFAAMCRKAGISAAVVCVTLVNRLKEDCVTLSPEDHEEYQLRPMKLIIPYIINHLLKTQ
ncbi:uridine phosphorylase 1-like isoform X2 [Xenia sp. Carnegie-2017]|nr:uridine phosphorylase 1-like isoform X2 [Xenia sp. Carnegie-2017]